MKKLFVLSLALLLCSACSLRQSGNTREALHSWQGFVARANAEEINTGPFRIAASLRYTPHSGESARVSALLWGNGSAANPYPLRLDLIAGVGNVVAKIREDEGSFLAYAPSEHTAYFHPRNQRTLVSFGVPIPLGISDLTLLLTGRSGELFLPGDGPIRTAMPAEFTSTDKGFAFTVRGAEVSGILELSSSGIPLSWREEHREGWTITFEPGAKNPLEPHRLRIEHPRGDSALIVVKEITHLDTPFTEAQLDLVLPPGTENRPLHE